MSTTTATSRRPSWNARRAVLADTGPQYAPVDAGDQYHARARGELGRLIDMGFDVVMAWSTVMEVQSLLMHRLGSHRAIAWLDAFLPGAFVVDPTPDMYDEAVTSVRVILDHPLSLFDAVLAILSERLDLPVWTFDHHFDVMRVPVWR